jgi:hypothetical protein
MALEAARRREEFLDKPLVFSQTDVVRRLAARDDYICCAMAAAWVVESSRLPPADEGV